VPFSAEAAYQTVGSLSKKKIAALVLLTLIVAVSGYAAWVWYRLPEVDFLKRQNPKETSLMRERGKKRVQHWVPLDRISERLQTAVIVAEDGGFYGHQGFDFYEIREAFERNWEEGRTVRGASTITQQLAKNLFLPESRVWWRKAQEAVITVMLELILTKRRILELYLNVAEWGDGVYGAEAAARYHYGVPAAALSPEQAARLAAMLPSPRSYSPRSDTLYLRERTADILSHMHVARIP
jgi:monofunctional biosynthetic peptidoglycan transglycosylase